MKGMSCLSEIPKRLYYFRLLSKCQIRLKKIHLTEVASCIRVCLFSSFLLLVALFCRPQAPPDCWHTSPSYGSCCQECWLAYNMEISVTV